MSSREYATKISELVKSLEELKEKIGDVEVFITGEIKDEMEFYGLSSRLAVLNLIPNHHVVAIIARSDEIISAPPNAIHQLP